MQCGYSWLLNSTLFGNATASTRIRKDGFGGFRSTEWLDGEGGKRERELCVLNKIKSLEKIRRA